jgi:hypothetical protein
MLSITNEELEKCQESALENPTIMSAINFTLLVKLLDIYIDHRIKQDKVIEGILRDIQAGMQQIADKKP